MKKFSLNKGFSIPIGFPFWGIVSWTSFAGETFYKSL